MDDGVKIRITIHRECVALCSAVIKTSATPITDVQKTTRQTKNRFYKVVLEFGLQKNKFWIIFT